MKISTLKTYQSVEFAGLTERKTQESFFVKRPTMPDLEMELVPGIGVSIRSPHDFIIVTLANIAYFRPTETAKPKQVEKTAKA